MMVICLIFDGFGVQLGLWIYPYDVFPFTPGYFPWDLSLFPVIMMTMIEIKPKLASFYKAFILATFFTISESFAFYLKLYEPIHWRFYYSFPIYIILFLICNKVAKSKVFHSSL